MSAVLVGVALGALGCGGEHRPLTPVDEDKDGFLLDEDCDDTEPAVNPGAAEVCDGADNNCDGRVDEPGAVGERAWYYDQDGDGFGAVNAVVTGCGQPSGYVAVPGDCDDTDAAFHPGAPEQDCADPNDYNCDGSTGYVDVDLDGFAACEDCDDRAAAVNRDAIEVCDGIDNDCDGTVDEPGAGGERAWYSDQDGDGYGDPEGATRLACSQPDGFAAETGDCDDTDATTWPDAPELCDGADNDCDGEVDELVASDPAHCGACGHSCVNAHGGVACASGACVPACDELWGDCDGDPDNGCESSLLQADNCGACGHVCSNPHGSAVCADGGCVPICASGWGDCDGDGDGGCETSLATSVQHCGQCGLACLNDHGATACVDAACLPSCEPLWGNCDGINGNGCELALVADDNCGACGRSCVNAHGTTACVDGDCAPACAAGYGDCNGNSADGCETPLDSVDHCGACGHDCSNDHGTAACVAGQCVPSCSAGYADCDGDPDQGCETTLGTVSDCGGCGDTCSSNHGLAACQQGACATLCNAGWGNCDRDPYDGCETPLNTLNNCGACFSSCSLANASETCVTGSCEIVTCSAGWCDADGLASGGCEYNLNTNPACSTYTYLGQVKGDAGSDIITYSNKGERRYRVYVAEADSSSSCRDLGARIRLTPGLGTDYDLYVYCESCSASVAQSINSGSATDEVHVRWDEDCLWGVPTGTNSSRNIYIWVVYRSAYTCTPYTLTVSGNVLSGGNTCAAR